MQDLILISNQIITKRFKRGHFVSIPLTNKSLFGGVKSRYKNRISSAKLTRITYISWSYVLIILHYASKILSVLNLDRKYSMQEKSLGFKTINYFFKLVGLNLIVFTKHSVPYFCHVASRVSIP
jgi:hypothetical protein